MTYNQYRQLIESERAIYERASMSELRNVRLALALHGWSNTLQEKARKDAVELIIHSRLKGKGKRNDA
jgi:hypothetical protein